jgi:ATP-dependent Clp protease ATP-binding subunit ClpA
VVVGAQNEARAAANDRITTGHLILGLLGEPEAVAVKLSRSTRDQDATLAELGVRKPAIEEGLAAALGS